ncbi:hypothetical protein EV193_101278 [Herbihabitans rhizosphaerae]|uniref:Uncharacterized protein n=1 Tax=Herbihabitans rhizosphaerae TaxID=1872711 RepID=A0A4Q7L7Q8_9PSEU|nr:hypothetical protein [Herbihabitans rhizosphaerae]RZS44402.1 hypothetical protein EV193_101278 [Herbihabitans rhizosphaerae]
MSETSETSETSEPVQDAAPPRRTRGRFIGGGVLILIGIGLLVVGIQAIADPSGARVGSSGSSRMDSDAEAQLGGFLMCFFGISVLGFGIGLLKYENLFTSKKTPPAGTPSGNESE